MTVPQFRRRLRLAAAAFAVALAWAAPAGAQVQPCPAPAKQPPAGSPVLVRCLELYAHPINETIIDQNTYLYYVKTKTSEPSKDIWAPYDADAVHADFWSLWRTAFLDNLWIEVIDEPFENGVAAKHIVFHIEERSRVKAVDYVAKEGTKTTVDISKIEERLRDSDVRLALDSFVDEATIRKVKGVIRQIYSDKGHNDVGITTELRSMSSGPKLVTLTFTIDQGPKYKLAEVLFDGNQAYTDAALRSQMKDNKPKAWWSFFTSGGTYLEAKFEEDAYKVEEFYQNAGYARALVGQPQIETVRDSKDGKTRFIRLRVPVEEGRRYRVGTFTVTENTAIKTEPLRGVFKVQEGDYYSKDKILKGNEKIKEIYGQLGFWEFSPDPSIVPRGVDLSTGLPLGDQEPPAIVDVTVKMVEGKRYYVNRITFTGNSTTHDAVARRELRIYEEGVFDTQALKESIRRLNQLGYFKPLEGNKEGEIDIKPTPGRDGLVDIKLKFEEQNRNQISFGAGVSQYDGFFGQLSYQTQNFLGRGETLGVSLQKGTRARQYQVSFTEPYLFDRPITAGIELYVRQFVYPYQYSQESLGGTVMAGYPLSRNTRFFAAYGYEKTHVYDINPLYLTPEALANLNLREALLLDRGGYRTVSKVVPSVVYNTVNQPMFPSDGERYSATLEMAGAGGNTYYTKMRFEGIYYIPFTRRLSLGLRGEGQWISPRDQFGLPIFEKFFLGGEYTVRGFDMRSISPRDPQTGIVTGGNKTVVFNAELYFQIAGPVRVLAFYDAGQVRDLGEPFGWWQETTAPVPFDRGRLYDPFVNTILTAQPYVPTTQVVAKSYAFKVSTGAEVRFFMPVLNVPFRLIMAYNPSRFGVLNNNLQLTKSLTFRFAVGTMF